MVKQRIIIGANLGDEGKGSVVAHYTKHATGPVLNVLTNGGSQRAHSIQTDDGIFTFKHFGSGTYYGADSYFSKYFIINPIQFCFEYTNLKRRINMPKIFRHPDCMWSTPYDMMANQIIEDCRGKDRHGTCGMGIWETVKRYKNTFTIPFDVFMAMDYVRKKKWLKNIKSYFEKEIEIPENWKNIWNDNNILAHFISDCQEMCNYTSILITPEGYDEIIYENGQGLMLCDQDKDIAGTTPSYTDSRDAINLLTDTTDVTVHYVTRPYLTRHGYGYLEGEGKNISSDIKDDLTNHYNIYQGDFRYGILDINKLKDRINSDKHPFKSIIELTHCDEMDRESEFKKTFEIVNTYDSALVK